MNKLITLSDGRQGLRSLLQVTTLSSPAGAASGDPATLEFFASTNTLDRFEEIIEPDGWKLDTYRRNPVFQNSHQYGDIIFTIGKALVTEVREAGPPFGRVLFQRVQFAVEANPIARIAYELYKGGFLNAVSVGFIPLRWEDGGPGAPCARRYLEQELLEVSAVGIPANPDALQMGVKSGALKERDLREAATLLLALCGRQNTPAPTAGENSLLRFARDLWQAVKAG